jgi:RimJ/RimL family protein N-acetyltransferase
MPALSNEISLVPFTWNHVRQTFHWVSDPELRRVFLMRGEPTWEDHLAYFERVFADAMQRVYAILAADRHIGNCGFKNLARQARTGELWIYIGEPSSREKKIGRSACELLLTEGFEVLGLETIYLHVAGFNTAARRLYEYLGFVVVPLSSETTEWVDRECQIVRMEVKR